MAGSSSQFEVEVEVNVAHRAQGKYKKSHAKCLQKFVESTAKVPFNSMLHNL